MGVMCNYCKWCDAHTFPLLQEMKTFSFGRLKTNYISRPHLSIFKTWHTKNTFNIACIWQWLISYHISGALSNLFWGLGTTLPIFFKYTHIQNMQTHTYNKPCSWSLGYANTPLRLAKVPLHTCMCMTQVTINDILDCYSWHRQSNLMRQNALLLS